MLGAPSQIAQRIKKLQSHLARENPVLLDVVKSFRQLDRVAYRLGMLERHESFATKVPWWPMVSVLGTFSSGKSTFINGYLDEKLQPTGNQAVDDKFTVICYGGEDANRTLPGRALDADPRFPFFQISHSIEVVAPGEGQRIDVYLQLKTCRSESLRGKIFIDSPGFDADEQRNSTLRITDHIIDLSDLVLVFFDARHPEPGAMQDTLEHLVGNTIRRADSNKFLYILNQIDNAAREDNPEEVFAAWQRALAQKGLTAGRFYSLYAPHAAITIEDEELRRRFAAKRDHDMDEIDARLQQVEVERAYRIIGVLEQTALTIRERMVPTLREAKATWRRGVLWLDGIIFGALAIAILWWSVQGGYWEDFRFTHPWYDYAMLRPALLVALGLVAAVAAFYIHHGVRKLSAGAVSRKLSRNPELENVMEWVQRAFANNIRPWRLSVVTEPAGWGGYTRRKLQRVLDDADKFVQALNNRFADPSGTNSRTPERPKPHPPKTSAAPTAPRAILNGVVATATVSEPPESTNSAVPGGDDPNESANESGTGAVRIEPEGKPGPRTVSPPA